MKYSCYKVEQPASLTLMRQFSHEIKVVHIGVGTKGSGIQRFVNIFHAYLIQRGAWHQICPGIMNPTRWLMLLGAYELDALYLTSVSWCLIEVIELTSRRSDGQRSMISSSEDNFLAA